MVIPGNRLPDALHRSEHLDPEAISEFPGAPQNHEHGRCRFALLSQPTEYDPAYASEEIEEICLCAHERVKD